MIVTPPDPVRIQISEADPNRHDWEKAREMWYRVLPDMGNLVDACTIPAAVDYPESMQRAARHWRTHEAICSRVCRGQPVNFEELRAVMIEQMKHWLRVLE